MSLESFPKQPTKKVEQPTGPKELKQTVNSWYEGKTFALPRGDEKRRELLNKKLEKYYARQNELKKKLEEYRDSNEPTDPDLFKKAEENFLDASYKAFILSKLLENGKINPVAITNLALSQLPDHFSKDVFDLAGKVIMDYCLTGGENNSKQLGETERRAA